jgi:DNA polymerase-3 subunit gamma/tau
MEDGQLEIALGPGAPRAIVGELSKKLSDWTGRRWMVVVSAEAGAPTLREQAQAHREELSHGIQADPLVQAVLTRFPGAAIVGVQPRHEPAAVHEASAEAGEDGTSDDTEDLAGDLAG